MLKTVLLLLPALIPSWRFFGTIEPSPRIEVTVRQPNATAPEVWSEFRPRPQRTSASTMIKRLFSNPQWNEGLFLVTCAERVIAEAEGQSATEIHRRIARDLMTSASPPHGPSIFRFRLVFVAREGEDLTRSVLYTSPPLPLEGRWDEP